MEIFRVYIRYVNEKDRQNLQSEHSTIKTFLNIYLMKIKCYIRIRSLSLPEVIYIDTLTKNVVYNRIVHFVGDNTFISFLLPYITDYYDDNAKEYGFVESEYTISELIEIYSRG